MSATSLITKLGYKPADTILIVDAPSWFRSFAEDNELQIVKDLPAAHVQVFCNTYADMQQFLAQYSLGSIETSLWMCWHKKSSGIATDIGEESFRDQLLPLNWVDIKVAAIDDIWSGLKFVRRKTSR